MTTCPTCGRPVPENQRYCGNCGTDVRVARTYQEQQGAAAPEATPPTASTYPYDTSPFSYAALTERRPSTIMIALIVAMIALVCLCCGMVLGAGGWYWLGPVPATPTPHLSPPATPSGLILLFFNV